MGTEGETIETWETLFLDQFQGQEEPHRKTYIQNENRTVDLFFDAVEPENQHGDESNNEKEQQTFEGFRVLFALGQGGMGVVQAVRQHSMNRQVAIKQALNKGLQSALIQEALITGSLSHPNIISVFELVQNDQDEVGIVMPLINGKPWSVRRAEAPKLSLLEEIDILIRVALAVEYAHDHGVLHNDLKLENVMVGDHGNVILMDWGCASANQNYAFPEISLRKTENIRRPFGTPVAMSPECARGDGLALGTWSDTYLLGAMLYEIVENRMIRTGKSLKEIIQRAVTGEIRPMQTDSVFLKELCSRALAVDPQDRFQTTAEFIAQLRNYFSIQSAETLYTQAQRDLETCVQVQAEGLHLDQSYILEVQRIIHVFEQAQQLWPNAEYRNKIYDTRYFLAKIALGLGDLSLAKANIDCLPSSKRETIENTYQKQRKAIISKERTARNLRYAIASMALILFIGLAVSYVIVNDEKQISDQRLKNFQALSRIQLYQDLHKEEATLWPAVPRKISDMEKWLEQANTLTALLQTYEERESELVANRVEGHFQDPTMRWEFETLERLITGIKALQKVYIPSVEKRIEDARSLEQRSILSNKAKWDDAIQSISTSSLYGGLRLKPQLGLVPLEMNTHGYWEFAHLLSGDVPQKGEAGTWMITENTGMIFVLLPPGDFWMGAEAQKEGSNYDPRAKDIEGPTHRVALEAFFLSKYEMNQSQWLKVQRSNPSAYLPGQEQGGFTINQLHPVEHMTWSNALQTVERLDLTLPTEAQWEYGNRAGSRTIYWGGDDIASMRGKLNISDRISRENGAPASWKYEVELDDGFTVHAPIGSFEANAFGLHDTAGNVWEWCLDLFGEYSLPTKAGTGERLIPEGETRRIFRGGGFRASSVHARSADRYSIYAQDYSAYDVGLRPAKPVLP